MSKIIAVIPNICEGRDRKFIDELAAQLNSVPNLMMLDVSMDHIRNRTVFGFTGPRDAIFEGGLHLYEVALARIDMRRHQGAYPRIGSVDVFPFVPLKDVTIAEAVQMSVEFAELVAARFKIPVYLFSESARYPARRDIDNIREGEYEGFAEKIKEPRWRPDFGPETFPADTGATIIGARHPLISFSVLLHTTDLEAARAVCQIMQWGHGGLPHVKAHLGCDEATQHPVITVSIHNFRETPMYRVIEMLRMECRRYGISLGPVEMIGLIPEVAFVESAEYYMGIRGFDHEKLLERNIQKHLDEKFLFTD
ncbi:MAG TPA: glutamate formimidoyltransferase [Acidobacteriota bacterium]|nr:glutamate formimidoyltransferase [Acidobacteriota bacterium]HQF87043.1 glutamate formimidoyltransferase [Acidobacteriota bacterium]HQG91604.1 glutamate formimidoyltransferase [Acidobacteriota bacterium]HQK87624.1 glutamate formimidoyltransferase [Acidobacteriota bacterium]